MFESRANAVDDAVALIRQATEEVEHLNRTPQEAVTTDGIVVDLNDAIRGIEALGDEEDE